MHVKSPRRVLAARLSYFRGHYDLPSRSLARQEAQQFYDEAGDFIEGKEREYRKTLRWTSGVKYETFEELSEALERKQETRHHRLREIGQVVETTLQENAPAGQYARGLLSSALSVDVDEYDNVIIVSMPYYGYILNAGVSPHPIMARALSGMGATSHDLAVWSQHTILTSAYERPSDLPPRLRPLTGTKINALTWETVQSSVTTQFRAPASPLPKMMRFWWRVAGTWSFRHVVHHPGTLLHQNWISLAMESENVRLALDRPPRPRVEFAVNFTDESTDERNTYT